ncbi:S49 family peptidase [Brucella sp. TWI432]
MKVLEAALSAPWLIVPQNLEDILSIAAREYQWTPEVLEKYRSRPLDRSERATQRDGVAILNVHGALFKRANLFVEMCGATSYDILRRDLQAALDNPSVKAICLNIDSPGGMASGCDELAQAIYEARGKKPITSYVTGMACSAGYWIASAADKIVLSDSSMVGSIGVVMTIPKSGDKGTEIVSSNAPGKRPDAQTDEGKARIQQVVDDLEAVFISTVARNRGVSEDTVKQKFGSGGVEIGKNAVALGMADKVGQFEQVLADLQKSTSTPSSKISIKGEGPMGDIAQKNGEPADESLTTQEEQKLTPQPDAAARIEAIITADAAAKAGPFAHFLAFKTDLSVEVAIDAMASAEKAYATSPVAQPETFEQRKASAGALGLAPLESPRAMGNPLQAAADKLNANFAK